MQRLSLSFKITNWCNLKCPHCMENSAPENMKYIMPVELINKYISEFKVLDLPKSDTIVFTGGEPVMPFNGINTCYLPSCMDIVYDAGMTPLFLTNGLWGDSGNPAYKLDAMVTTAKRHKQSLNLDMAWDEYHDNRSAVINIVRTVINTPGLRDTLRLSLTGMNTPKKRAMLVEFIDALKNIGYNVTSSESDNTLSIYRGTQKKAAAYVIPYQHQNMLCLGRSIYGQNPKSATAPTNNVLQINNNHTAQLNMGRAVSLDNKDLKTLLAELQTIQHR